MKNPLSLRHWIRLWAGSAVNVVALGWFYHLGFGTPITDALIPVCLVFIGMVLSWPIAFRAVFGGLLYRDPDVIHNEIISDDD